MSDLSFCLQAAALHDEDSSALTDAIERYVGAGMPMRRAQLAAIADVVADVRGEREQIQAALREQHPAVKPAAEGNPFHTFLMRQGVALRLAADFAPGTRERLSMGRTFRRDGLELDQLAQRAAEQGFLRDPQDVDGMYQLIARSAGGERIAPLFGADGEAELAARVERHRQLDEESGRTLDLAPEDLAATGFTQADPDVQARVRLILAKAEMAGVDPDSILADAAHSAENASDEDFLRAAQSALDAALTRAGDTGAHDRGAGAGQEGAEPARADQGQAGAAGALPHDVGGEPRQGAREPDAPYQTDLFGSPIPREQQLPFTGLRPVGARPQGAGLRGNVQPEPAVPGDTQATKGDYHARTLVATPVARQLGAARIASPGEAAAATSYLYRSAVERLDGIVTDFDGKPLAVIGGFKGALSQTSVYPSTLVAEAVRVPGAAKIWFSHNHPSGTSQLSQADEHLSGTLADVFRGSGIEPMGLLAVANGKFHHIAPDGRITDGDIVPAKSGVSVPVYERELSDGRTAAPVISSPRAAIDESRAFYRREDGPGLLLLDAQLKIIAWVPLTDSMYGRLRDTGGLRAIYRAVSEANAGSAIIVHGGELDARPRDLGGVTVAQNIGAALRKIDVRPLDIINAKTGASAAEKGIDLADGPVFSRTEKQQPFYSALSREVEAINAKAQPAEGWRSQIQGLIAKGRVKADEVEWSGLNDWLKLQDGKVTKQQVLDYLDHNGVQVQEVMHAGLTPEAQRDKAFHDQNVEFAGDKLSLAIAKASDYIANKYGQKEAANASLAFNQDRPGQNSPALDRAYELLGKAAPEGYDLNTINDAQDEFDSAARHREVAAQFWTPATKFSNYTLPGGENHRELLLTLPEMPGRGPILEKRKAIFEAWQPRIDAAAATLDSLVGKDRAQYDKAWDEYQRLQAKRDAEADANAGKILDGKLYRSGHWDEPNILAHIRLNDRTDADGKRTLFVEELQSDWAQQGRKQGFAPKDARNPTDDEVRAFFDLRPGADPAEYRQEMVDMLRKRDAAGTVPRAPFVDSTDKWLPLALKRIVKLAADEGYDRVAFVNGAQSADRYSLSKQVNELSWRVRKGEKQATVDLKGGDQLTFHLDDKGAVKSVDGTGEATFVGKPIDEIVGKDLATKIMADSEGRLAGEGLNIGGAGMKAFYDKIVPAAVNKLLPKLGGDRLGEVQIDRTTFGKNGKPADWNPKDGAFSAQPGFDVTPAMREKVAGGVPLFRLGDTEGATLQPTQIQRAVDKLTLNWLKKPDIHVIDSMTDAPGPVRQVWMRQNAQGAAGDVEGFYFRGGVYIVADAMHSGSDIIRVLYHESLGHFGLRQVFGDRLDSVLKQVATFKPQEMRDKAAQYGYDLTNESQRMRAAEEILAEMAQSRPTLGIVQRAIAAIRSFLRENIPGFDSLKMTDAEIVRNFLTPAREAVENGGRAEPRLTRAEPSFSRTKSADEIPNEERTAKLADRIGAGYHAYAGVEQPARQSSGTIADSIAKALVPAGRKDAVLTSGIIRANLGEQARGREVAQQRLMEFAKRFDKMPVAENYKFIDAMERGVPLKDPEQARAAAALRKVLDERRDQVIALGKGNLENFNENYFPHIWKDKAAAANFFTRRPLEGGKGFLKQRTYDFFADGLKAGLEPVTTNPVELAMLKAREMDRYIYGQRIFGEMKDAGVAKFVAFGAKAPDGWVKINDKIARVMQYSEAEKGMILRGEYYAPEQAATLINNHLSPGLSGIAAFDMIRKAGNMMNAVQLGLSAFHLGFTTLDAMISKAALGIKQASRGDVLKGAGNMLQSLNPAQPLMNLYKGDRLLKAYLGNVNDPELAPIVEALTQGGGRVKMDDVYRNAAANEFRQAIRKGNYGTAAMKVLPRMLDLINKPIFEYLVPRQKLGVFFDMARDALEHDPGMDLARKREVMGKLWDSVDNRMGELVYDNVFWNRALKDALQVSVRSVGWNLGTFREIGGGVKDIGSIKKLGGLSDRTSYIFGLTFVTAMAGMLTQYLYTGEGPKELKDVFFPRTGKTRPDGTEDRLSLPSYMKDIYEYGHDLRNFAKYGEDPFHTLENKLHPLVSTMAQIFTNKDFFGGAIRSPGDTPAQQSLDEAHYLLKQMSPFSLRNYQQQAKLKGEEPSIGGYLSSPSMIGITPAPGYITKNDAQAESSQVNKMRESLITKFREEMRDGADWPEIRQRAMDAGIRGQDLEYIRKSAVQRPPKRLKEFAAH